MYTDVEIATELLTISYQYSERGYLNFLDGALLDRNALELITFHGATSQTANALLEIIFI